MNNAEAEGEFITTTKKVMDPDPRWLAWKTEDIRLSELMVEYNQKSREMRNLKREIKESRQEAETLLKEFMADRRSQNG